MAEYIEREAAIRAINGAYQFFEDEKDVFRRIIKSAPAADVAPVVHGRWEIGKDHGEFGEAKCTACGGILLVKWSDRLSEYRYCPNCGARMDGE